MKKRLNIRLNLANKKKKEEWRKICSNRKPSPEWSETAAEGKDLECVVVGG